MSDLINRQDAIDAICDDCVNEDYCGRNCEEVQRMIDLPSVQKKGKWTLQDDRTKNHYGWQICSECGAWISEPTNFCPNCGADMRGEQE